MTSWYFHAFEPRDCSPCHNLSASLAISIAGVDQQTADELVHKADAICPYSNAVRGNVDVAKTVTVR